jgi:hypothetical protein
MPLQEFIDTHLQFLETLVFVRRFDKPMLDDASELAENARCVFSDVHINE